MTLELTALSRGCSGCPPGGHRQGGRASREGGVVEVPRTVWEAGSGPWRSMNLGWDPRPVYACACVSVCVAVTCASWACLAERFSSVSCCSDPLESPPSLPSSQTSFTSQFRCGIPREPPGPRRGWPCRVCPIALCLVITWRLGCGKGGTCSLLCPLYPQL